MSRILLSDYKLDFSGVANADPYLATGFSVLDGGAGGNVKVLDGVLMSSTNTSPVYLFKSGNNNMVVGEVKMRLTRFSGSGVAGVAIMDASGNGYRASLNSGNRVQLQQIAAFVSSNLGSSPTPAQLWYTNAELSLRFEVVGSDMQLSVCVNGNPYITMTDTTSAYINNLKPAWWFNSTLNLSGINAIGVDNEITLPDYETYEVGYSNEVIEGTTASLDPCAHILLSPDVGDIHRPRWLVGYGDQVILFSIKAESSGDPHKVDCAAYIHSNQQVLGDRVTSVVQTVDIESLGGWYDAILQENQYKDLGQFVDQHIVCAYQSTSDELNIYHNELGFLASESKAGTLANPWGVAGTDSNFLPNLKMVIQRQVWPTPPIPVGPQIIEYPGITYPEVTYTSITYPTILQ